MTDLSLEAAMICDMCDPPNNPKQTQYWFDIGKYWECRQPTFGGITPFFHRKLPDLECMAWLWIAIDSTKNLQSFAHQNRQKKSNSCRASFSVTRMTPPAKRSMAKRKASKSCVKNGVAKMPLFMGPCSCYTPGKLRWNHKNGALDDNLHVQKGDFKVPVVCFCERFAIH